MKENKNSMGINSFITGFFTLAIIISLFVVAWKVMFVILLVIFIICLIMAIVKPKKQFSPTSATKSQSGLEYEYFCAEWLMKDKGYRKVTVTPPTGDFGADLVANDKHGKRWVFQCKYYQSKLDNTPIQEVVTAKAHYHANKAGVITNTTFTNKAKQLARDNQVVLYERVTSYRTKPKKKREEEQPYTIEEMMFYDDICEP